MAIEMNPLILDAACFHCQQCVEKYLKAYLFYKGEEILKIHDLTRLRKGCAKFDSDFADINFKDLNAYAVEARYPDNFLAPDLSEAKEYLQIAEAVKGLVRKKIIF
jgi:HEPN domain-containing protein